ncbi:MAG: NrdH-redoxin [Candidatus Staskawiczbacteria bacterium RIFCSPLOWO2_01_FULL_33_9]|uniref:NrdH-redoxin n=1 Tax=Candidatus Staskawiczbacteria bacterium RIFCSPLOWO2_01_FULL_33_9 TaxID=1802211 RepID=A0A1G2IAG0_9BACT|nr:MAG: NrdH-redoxin [Candidatus Staskawiczbacteria bacterium RIFCSPLOWO2_01_FULL_33_9]
MIKLYTTPTCVYCVTLKEYFKNHNIDFEEIDVSNNDEALQEMITISNQMGVPVVDIDGEVVIGFNKAKIDKILKIQQ